MSLVLACAISYLIGSITVGPLLAAARGVNLRSIGSGNIGATNVMRAIGKKAALVTLLGDLSKGCVAVLLGMMLLKGRLEIGLCGIAAVLGHNFPLFLGFRGGKGVATSLGVLLAYVPFLGLLFAAVWVGAFRWKRISSLAALSAFAVTAVTGAVLYSAERPVVLILAILSALMHRQNISRLLRGTEPRMGAPSS